MVMLDLQKTFDTVDHEIMLIKLRDMGFKQVSSKMGCSYLQGRKQIVDVDGILSKPKILNCRVPQGSVLGPLFFYCL